MILHSTSDYSWSNGQKQIQQQNSRDWGHDNSSDLVTRQWARWWKNYHLIPKQQILLFSPSSRPVLVPIQSPFHCIPGGSNPGGKLTRVWSWLLSPIQCWRMNKATFTPPPLYTLVAWHLIIHKNNLIFTLYFTF